MKPNILVIITDQQRQDHLGCYGNTIIRTPNIDRLAAEGVRFDRHYVNNPLCMPGRATLFTGLTPRAHTVRTNGINLPPSFPVLPGILGEAGYQSHLVGKLHLDSFSSQVPGQATETDTYKALKAGRPAWGFESGEIALGHGHYVRGSYEDWLTERLAGKPSPWRTTRPSPIGSEQCVYTDITPELHHSGWVGERTVEFLRRGRDPKRPFFLWCSFPDPHHPYCPPQTHADMYPPKSIPVPPRREGELDELPPHFRQAAEGTAAFAGRQPEPTLKPDAQYQEIIGRTYGEITLIDDNVGRILDALREEGLEENTIVIFTSDHGDLMGDHGLLNKGPFHFEGLLKVPFIVRWPKQYGPGRVVRGLTSHLDFVPTLLGELGVAFPEGVAAQPPVTPLQRPPLTGKSLAPLLRGDAERVREAVLVENDEDYIGSNLRTVVTERFKLTTYSERDFGELFDLKEDPHELFNLWSRPECRQVKLELKARLLETIMETDSPLPRRISHA